MLSFVSRVAHSSIIPLSIVALCGSLNVASAQKSALNTQPPPNMPASARALSEASAQVTASVSPCVISIEAPESKTKDKRLQYWLEYYGEQSHADEYHFVDLGSGVLISGDGYIVTNNHVIKDADDDSIIVKLTDGTGYFAQIVGQDPSTDLAVLRIYGPKFPAAYVGNSDEVKVGEFVYAVGNPHGFETSVSSGIVSALDRHIERVRGDDEDPSDAEAIHHFIQVDAAINPGNSGGGLFNIEGQLIGINSMIYSRSGGFEGIGMAIPANLMRAVVEDLITDGHVHRGVLGIDGTDDDEDIALRLHCPSNKGFRVDAVDKGSAAEAAGLKKDDIITAIDGVPVANSSKLKVILITKKPNQTIKLSIWRDGAKSEVSATLKAEEERRDFKSEPYHASLGVNALTLSASDASRLSLPNSQGALVKTSYKYGAAAKAGIYEDDVIVQAGSAAIGSPDDLAKVISAAKPGDVIKIKLMRKNQPIEKDVMLQAIHGA